MKAAIKSKSKPEKLTKKDPDFYSKIATLGGKKTLKKKGKKYFSELAKASHPRKSYNGGRPKKTETPEPSVVSSRRHLQKET
jgi:hypothetical protein